jgi:hypothetical protein
MKYFLDKGFIQHTEHCYSVKNQNGFNNALYHFYSDDGLTKKHIRSKVSSWPKKYPCTIVIINQLYEWGNIRIEAFTDLKTPFQK